MEGMRSALPFLLIAALAHQTIASKCTAGCVGNNGNIFNYQPGTVYKYEMEGNSVMHLAGAEGDVSKMTVKASADVAALPDCGFSISLSNLHISDKDGKSVECNKGQPVIFSMNNGVVTSDICSANDEPIDALNIKRAIISLLQSSSDSQTIPETDLFGTCPTDIHVHKSGAKLKVKKTKNLNNCAHRQNLMIPFTSPHYHLKSDLQSIPWISADQKIDQDVEGQVKWVMSKEEYSGLPVGGTEVASSITVTTKLTLKGTGGGAAAPAGIEKEQSILLGVEENSGENNLKTAAQILKKICEGAQNEIDKDNANKYAYLAYILSRSNKATMTGLFNQVKQGQICADKETAKKALFDAIYDSQSADGVQVMAELLKNKEVTGLKAQIWYGSLGNVRHATPSALKAAAAMLDGDAPNEAYLGAGSLLGRYCHTHNCENVPEVNQLQKKLSAPLAKGCKAPSLAEEDKLIASIKGLGNSGYLGGPPTKQLVQCASDHTARSRVRAASLDALHTDPNKEIIKKAAIEILNDKNEDSELRIKAYLIIVECPCGKMAAVIKDVLDKEDSFQVGNFIVSHLRNIRASKNPDKALAKAHFSSIISPKSFPFDIRKYSTNFETSSMLDSLNLGGSAESNVIYSQKSWIPRGITLNLTSQFFGNSFNLLEMDVRAENLERMLEKIVGPRGYITHDPNEISNDVNTFWNKATSRAGQTFRPKRGVAQNDIDALAKTVNLGVDFGEDDESLDLSLKMFGSEVAWIPLHGTQLDKSPSDTVNSAFDLLDGILDKAKNVDVDYTKHKVLGEGMVAYPTAMGVPLKFKGIVSTAVRVKVDGKLDLPAILRDPKNALVKFQVIPSGAVTGSIIALMEAGGVNTGVKISATAHSSTGSDVTFRILEGKGVDIKVGLPIPKQEIISLKTEIISISDTPQGKNAKPVTFNVKREEYSGCFDQVSEVLGLTFCGEVSTPWEGTRIIHPAFGPSNVVVRVEKEDPSITNFHFKAFYNAQKEAPQHHFEIVLDTPNSKKERRLGVLIENTIKPHLGLKAAFDSPFGNAKLDTSAINSAEEKSINAEMSFADHEYIFKAGIKQAGPNKYKPFLEYKAPEGPKSRYSALNMDKLGQQSITVSGDINVDGNKMIFDGVKVSISRQEYNIDGSIWDESATTGADLKVTYADDVLVIKANREKINPHHTKRTVQVTSQKYPDVSVNAVWDLDVLKKPKFSTVKSDIIVVHGPDPNSESSRVTVTNHFHLQTNPGGSPLRVDCKNLVLYPIVNLKGKVDFHADEGKFGYEIDGSFETYKAGSALEVVVAPEYSIDFSGKLMENSIIGHMKRQSAGDDKSKFTNSLELNPGGKYQLNALVTHKLQPDDVDAHVEAKISLPSDPTNIEINAGIKDTKDVHNGILWVSVNGQNKVDGKVSINKGKEVDGTFKLILTGYVDSHGKLKFGPNGVDGNAVLNLIKPNKKIEGKTNIAINNPTIKGTADLCLDSKCIKLSTDSTINKQDFDAHGKLELPGGLMIAVNAKCDENKGTHSADAEFKGSDGHQTKLTYASTRHLSPGDSDVEYIASVEDVSKAGDKPRRVEAKLVGKHIDLVKATGDGQLIVTYQTPSGKDLSFHTNFKRAPGADNKWIHNAEVGATGSLITSPLTLKFVSDVHGDYFIHDLDDIHSTLPPANYQMSLAVGNELQVESSGKAADQSFSNELIINLPQAKEGIKNFKWSSNNNFNIKDTPKLKTSNTIKWDGKFIKTNVEIAEDASGDGVIYNMDLEGDNIPKRTLSGNIHICDLAKGGVCKNEGSLAMTWDDKKADISYTTELDVGKRLGLVHVKGTLPDGTKFDVNSKGKSAGQGENEIALHGETTVALGNKKWAGTSTVELDKTKYHLNFILEHPEGTSQFKSLNLKKGDMHWFSEYALKWVSNGGGSWTGDSEINFENENSFSIISHMDSPKMNLNKFYFGAKVTPDKKLDIEVKNNGKTVAAAKTSYQYVAEGTKRKVEGSGNVNVDGKEYPLSYDATFEASPGINSIIQMAMNVKAGERSMKFVSQGKWNNFFMKRTYCKSSSDCSEAEFSYENKNSGAMGFEQNLIYKVDFSLFNPNLKDLKITSKVKREGLTFDQNVDFNWGDSKLKYNAFIHANKAGASLTLPQRTLAAEASYGLPKKDKNAVKFEGSVWLDKAKTPNKRTHLLLLGEVGQNKEAYTANAEARFNNPALPKPLVVKGKLMVSNTPTKPAGEGNFEIDVFKKPQMKIAGNWKFLGKHSETGFDAINIVNIKSEGLKININFDRKVAITKDSSSWIDKLTFVTAGGESKEAIAKYELTTKNLHVLVKIPDVTITNYQLKWDLTDDSLTVSEDLELLGAKYKEQLNAKLHPLSANYKFINNKGCGNKVFTMDASYEMGNAAKLDVGFDGKSILSGELSLAEETFLKPHANFNKESVNMLNDCYEKSGVHVREEVKKILDKKVPLIKNDIEARKKLFQDAEINYGNVAKVYQEEFEKIQDEILADKNLQGVIGIVKESLSVFFENGAQIIEEIQSICSKTQEEIHQALDKLTATIQDLIPKITKSFEDLLQAALKLGDDLIHIIVNMSDIILHEIAAHSEEINAFIKSFSDICEDYGKTFFKYAFQINNDIKEFVEQIIAQLKEMPLEELYQEQLEIIKSMIPMNDGDEHQILADLTQELVGYLDDMLNQLKESKSFPELEELIETIRMWMKKAIIDKEEVDNAEYAKKTATIFFGVIKHLFELINEQIVANEGLLSKSKLPLISKFPLSRIPPGLLRLSGISWLTSSDLPSLVQVIATYLPAMNPNDWLPPFTARAYLIGGSEIITFDGTHLSVAGDCNYVLTQDYLDGNFSVIANFKGGKLDAIQVTDGKDSVELRHDKKPLVNGKESEFPIFQGQIKSWKRAAVVGLSTKSGLKIICTPDCLRCKFKVDGLYFGRLRGLLGTYNYEQFDEHTLPSGKIADSEDKFLTAWSVGGACNANAPETVTKDEPTCVSTFYHAATFMPCYHFVDPKPYKDACNQLAVKETTPEGIKDVVCNVALAYSLQCQTRIPVAVPPSCLQCSESKTKVFHKTATIEPPYKKADVVFAVERLESNKEIYENLIKPLVQSIKADLGAKGISDVKFGLVGFGGKKRAWPAYYTNNGEILADNLETGNLVFDALPPKTQIGEVIESGLAESGVTGKTMTYMDLAEFYPWRVGSSKVVVGFHATPCKESKSLLLLQHLYYIGSYANKGITFYTMSPAEMKWSGGEDASDVLAFNHAEVYSNKGPVEGMGHKVTDKEHTFTPDACYTFASMTGGYIYPANNYISGGAPQKEAIKKSMTYSIVDSLTNAANQQTQQCTCLPKANMYDGIFSQADCRIVNIELNN